jgi:hypothetical protein
MMMMSSARDGRHFSRIDSIFRAASIRSFCERRQVSAALRFFAIFQWLMKSARRRLARVKDATRDATSAAPSVSPPRAVL